MSHNIWNLTHPQRTGHIRLIGSGKEIFGTVIRHGKMSKTVTVSVQNDPCMLALSTGEGDGLIKGVD